MKLASNGEHTIPSAPAIKALLALSATNSFILPSLIKDKLNHCDFVGVKVT